MPLDPGRRVTFSDFGKEPFHFFPGGALAGILGVSLWPLHFGGLVNLYPGQAHARIMIYGLFGPFHRACGRRAPLDWMEEFCSSISVPCMSANEEPTTDDRAGLPRQELSLSGNSQNGPPPGEVSQVVEHLFRRESGKMVATLTRIFGLEHLNLAEDVVQEALVRALQTWPFYGIPENPAAWIMRASRNLALDAVSYTHLTLPTKRIV